MKKILIIANNAGGLYIFRKDLIKALVDRGYQVVAVTPFTSRIPELKSLGIKLIDSKIDRRGTNPLKELELFKEYKRIITKVSPDLIITYTVKPNIYGGLIARRKHIPYAVNITGLGSAFQDNGLLKFMATHLYKVALKNAKVVFFENRGNADYFIRNHIIDKGQEKVLNGAGVDTEHFNYLEYPTVEEPVNFLFVGRVMKEKGVDELFLAMKRLRKEGFNCILTVVGTLEENYKDKIEKYTAEHWLNYVGYSQDVREQILNAHCSILPSWHEGMSNTNLECASSGRPLITSDIPGCKEAVIPGETGMLSKVKDSESLFQTMKAFVELPYDRKMKMGIRGREHMINIFDKKMVVKNTLSRILSSNESLDIDTNRSAEQ